VAAFSEATASTLAGGLPVAKIGPAPRVGGVG
jgi:hypothetical protein